MGLPPGLKATTSSAAGDCSPSTRMDGSWLCGLETTSFSGIGIIGGFTLLMGVDLGLGSGSFSILYRISRSLDSLFMNAENNLNFSCSDSVSISFRSIVT